MTQGLNCSGISLYHSSFLLWSLDCKHGVFNRGSPLCVCLGCLLIIFLGISHRQQCQGLLFSGSDHVLSHAMTARAAKR